MIPRAPVPAGYASDVSGIAIAGYALLAVAALLLLAATVASVRRRRTSVDRSPDLPSVGAAVTPPGREPPEVEVAPVPVPAASPEHDELDIPAGGPLTDTLPVGESAELPVEGSPIEASFDLEPWPNERRRSALLAGAATFAAGAALAWLFSRRRKPPT